MLINFPDSPWFGSFYPNTQKMSKIMMELEKLSKKQCTCLTSFTYDRCDTCVAKSTLTQMEMIVDRKEVQELVEKYKSKKKK